MIHFVRSIRSRKHRHRIWPALETSSLPQHDRRSRNKGKKSLYYCPNDGEDKCEWILHLFVSFMLDILLPPFGTSDVQYPPKHEWTYKNSDPSLYDLARGKWRKRQFYPDEALIPAQTTNRKKHWLVGSVAYSYPPNQEWKGSRKEKLWSSNKR